MVAPILGSDFLRKQWKNVGGKLKKLARPLIKDGIGDKMDKGNLWIVPGFTLLVFAGLWTTKLSKIALEESTCRGANIYDLTGTTLDADAQRHCQTAKRYFVAPEEPFSYDLRWREEREVKNPEWILWFWAPIVFVMYVMTRFLWSLLLENQGINFPNIVAAANSVWADNENGILEVDEEKLDTVTHTVAHNFRCATHSRAFAAFILFEVSLVVAPVVLLLFVLPLMVGGGYRTWGADVGRAWWERKEWHGTPLTPVLGSPGHLHEEAKPRIPLIPRITYCDYHYVSLGNTHTLTYRCYLDANWHERTALFTWVMLAFLAIINLGNLFFWLEWAVRMRFKKQRSKWVLRKWLNNEEDFTPWEREQMKKFAESFRTGNLLLFYYIEAHTDRVVASAFCAALFRRWLEHRRRWFNGGRGNGDNDSPRSGKYRPPRARFVGAVSNDYGWNLGESAMELEDGNGGSPASPQYYSAESPSTVPLIQTSHHQHRLSASSESSTSSKPSDGHGPKYTSTPIDLELSQLPVQSSSATMETPRKRPPYQPYPVPRRGVNYARNLGREAGSRNQLLEPPKGGQYSTSPSKDKRKKERERDKRADKQESRDREQTGGSGGASRSTRCSIM